MNTITETEFYNLLTAKLAGEATNEQLLLLDEQLQLHPDWQFLYDQMLKPSANYSEDFTAQAYAAHAMKMYLQGKFESDHNLSSTYEESKIIKPVVRRSFLQKLAAPLLIAASLVGVILFIKFASADKKDIAAKVSLNEVATKKGSKSNIKLSDGTKVWLNADSKLTYTENFTGTTREVLLVGEAFFDVAHDTSRPFIIHIGKARIKVLGTSFNVRNYPQDNTWETTLMTGKIEVSLYDRPGEKIIMKPMEKLILNKTQLTLSGGLKDISMSNNLADKIILKPVKHFSKDSIVAETSWMQGKLIFVNQPLEKIAQELERQFTVTADFKTEEVKKFRYTGNFEKESLAKILEVLQLSRSIKYAITDSTLIFE